MIAVLRHKIANARRSVRQGTSKLLQLRIEF